MKSTRDVRKPYRTKVVECEACLNWYHLRWGNMSEYEYADIAETVLYCVTCKTQQEADRTERLRMVLKFF